MPVREVDTNFQFPGFLKPCTENLLPFEDGFFAGILQFGNSILSVLL